MISKNKNFKQKSYTFWDVHRFPLLVQRVFCISPIKLVGTRLHSSCAISTYSYIILCGFYSNIILSLYLMQSEGIFEYLSSGYLWRIICCFEFLCTIFTFGILIVYAEIKKHAQIAFIHKIDDIGVSMETYFQINIEYKHLRLQNMIGFGICIIYYEGILIYVLIDMWQRQLFGCMLFSLMYQTEQIVSGLIIWIFFNSVRLVRKQFTLLKELQKRILIEKQFDNKLMKNHLTYNIKLAQLLHTFKELCRTIDSFNAFIGPILFLNHVHDFTLVTSQCYVIFWILTDNGDDEKYGYVIYIGIWMLQNFVKIGLTAYSAELTINEVQFLFHLE